MFQTLPEEIIDLIGNFLVPGKQTDALINRVNRLLIDHDNLNRWKLKGPVWSSIEANEEWELIRCLARLEDTIYQEKIIEWLKTLT